MLPSAEELQSVGTEGLKATQAAAWRGGTGALVSRLLWPTLGLGNSLNTSIDNIV